MKWLFIYRRDLVVCYVYFIYFLHFVISFIYDFHVCHEKNDSQNARNVNKYLRRWLKHVWQDTSSIGKSCRYFRLRSTKLIFVGYCQINLLRYCFRFFALGMYDTSFLNMRHLGAGHIFFVREIQAILCPRSITTGFLSQTLY